MAPQLTDRYARALAYAADVHRMQPRKGPAKIPYVSHLLAASSLVIEAGGNEDEAIAALLHDTAEDQGGEPRLADIDMNFGPIVAAIVRECSDSLTEDSEDKAPWRDRKLAHLAHLRQATPSAILVTAADKLHNARSLVTDVQQSGPSYLRHFNATPQDMLWYYRQMYSVLIAVGAPQRLTVPLGECVEALDSLIAGRRVSLIQTVHGDWIRSDPGLLVDARAEHVAYERWVEHAADRSRDGTFRDRAVRAFAAMAASGIAVRFEVWQRGERWQINAVTPCSGDFVAAFRSDGGWIEPNGRVGNWEGVKEGGPEQLGQRMARDRIGHSRG